jgi:hypothetical protein
VRALPSTILSPCARPGCRRLCHLRYCPDHADDEQRDVERLRDEALLAVDLWRDRVDELDERLGVRRRSRE